METNNNNETRDLIWFYNRTECVHLKGEMISCMLHNHIGITTLTKCTIDDQKQEKSSKIV